MATIKGADVRDKRIGRENKIKIQYVIVDISIVTLHSFIF